LRLAPVCHRQVWSILSGIIFQDFLQCNHHRIFYELPNEPTKVRIKTPIITQPGHSTAIGVSLILDLDHKDIQFFEMNSAIKGYGGKVVDAVLKDLPKEWNGVAQAAPFLWYGHGQLIFSLCHRRR
jgi:hypothetical protein